MPIWAVDNPEHRVQFTIMRNISGRGALSEADCAVLLGHTMPGFDLLCAYTKYKSKNDFLKAVDILKLTKKGYEQDVECYTLTAFDLFLIEELLTNFARGSDPLRGGSVSRKWVPGPK